MDAIYFALVHISMLVYLGLPFFWLARHYVYLNYNMGKLEFKLATYVILIAFEAAVYFLLSPYIYVKQDLPAFAAPFGAAALALWIVLEGWSLYLLGKTIGKIGKMETRLVKHGPFSVIRHPIYVAHLLFNFGAYLVTGAVIPLMVLVEWLILIKPLADMEDEELALRIGEEFHKYKKAVPQLIPKIR